MSADGDLWGALGRAASEAAKAARDVAERAAAVARDQLPELQIGREQLRLPTSLLAGPTVPQPYKPEGTLSWHDGYMASCERRLRRRMRAGVCIRGWSSVPPAHLCSVTALQACNRPHLLDLHPLLHPAGALSVARAVQHHGVQPATTALVAAQAAAHFKPGGHRLLQVGGAN